VTALVILAAIFLYYKRQATTRSTAQTFQDIKKPSSTDAGRNPASIPAAGVPVIRAEEDGRETIRIAFEQKVELEMQRKEDLLNQYRLGPMPPLPGAGAFEMLKLKAVPKAQYEPRMGQLISEKLGFAIFATTQSAFELTAGTELPVLAKKGNGILGIVTGTIIVTLKENTLAPLLAQTYDLTLKYLDKDLRLAYFTAPANTPLDKVVEALQRDASVENVNLEVVQSRKRL